MNSYRDLVAWQHGVDAVAAVYAITKTFPKDELYGLTNQTRRAAVSIPANIAEGHARDSTAEYLHHLAYALGSLAELETHLTIAARLEYVSTDDAAPLFCRLDELGRILRGLQKSLRAKP
ncbi:MAG TPA: four helix bundle protein [Pirellulales bacterium]|jgi:four helix bundle protein|nr:four helix bundle protein [Pirellulales bacterium]